jgi:hypothetical protein
MHLATKSGSSWRKPLTADSTEENLKMRARPQVKTYLLITKLQRWARIEAYPSFYPNVSASTARRNYARLAALGNAKLRITRNL